MWIGLANVCLEDYTYASRSAPVRAYLKAEYNFALSSESGYGRPYYRSTLNSKTYDFYTGEPYPNARSLQNEPALTQSNGLYFDGNDYITQNVAKDVFTVTSTIMNFNLQFTIELWCRFIETNISQPYYMFQKINNYGTPNP